MQIESAAWRANQISKLIIIDRAKNHMKSQLIFVPYSQLKDKLMDSSHDHHRRTNGIPFGQLSLGWKVNRLSFSSNLISTWANWLNAFTLCSVFGFYAPQFVYWSIKIAKWYPFCLVAFNVFFFCWLSLYLSNKSKQTHLIHLIMRLFIFLE